MHGHLPMLKAAHPPPRTTPTSAKVGTQGQRAETDSPAAAQVAVWSGLLTSQLRAGDAERRLAAVACLGGGRGAGGYGD